MSVKTGENNKSNSPRKIRVAVFCGGRSAEHEVSLISARNIINGLDDEKYEILIVALDRNGKLIGIGEKGRTALLKTSKLLSENDARDVNNLFKHHKGDVALVQDKGYPVLKNLSQPKDTQRIDVVFPIMHGPYGEDGSVQGLAKLTNTAVVGSSILGSAINMDKDVMKRLLRDGGIPIPRFLAVKQEDENKLDYSEVTKYLGECFFIKPANLGSSVGVSKIRREDEFEYAVRNAFRYDRKILLEEAIVGRELECAVLGTKNPRASIPRELITAADKHEFYSYEAKYIDETGAVLEIPANLPEILVQKIQELAILAFKTTCCEGMARVDFFLRDTGELLVNELNTIPGFTDISMYPKLWEASGLSLSNLLDELIADSLERHRENNQLRVKY